MHIHTNMIVLNGTNYHLWEGEIKDLLFAEKIASYNFYY